MKIGIITFHWAANYGAVLQAYALQNYLISLGNEVSIINYKPSLYDFNLRSVLNRHFITNVCSYIKDKKIDSFRKKYLFQTKRYKSEKELQNKPPLFDIYITGSDQLWNPYFILHGEGKITLTYFLNFGDSKIRRIAYAISCGVVEYSDEVKLLLRPVINNFHNIGVRESSGINIVESLLYNGRAKLVPDPTLLLRPENYNVIIDNEKFMPYHLRQYIFLYILRDERKIRKISASLQQEEYLVVNSKSYDGNIGAWLLNIKQANFVITNSYHCMLFCIQFHVPFVVILEDGELSGMNDRFYTVLSMLDLDFLIMSQYDLSKIKEFVNIKICWDDVDKKLDSFRIIGHEFLKNAIKYE